MGVLDGRVVAITGASRGTGREHALAFADRDVSARLNQATIDSVGIATARLAGLSQ